MKRIKSLSLVVGTFGILIVLLLWMKREQQFTAFYHRLHMVEKVLWAYQKEHGKYPDVLSQPGWKVDDLLAGATYRYYNSSYASKSNAILIDGSFRGRGFEVTTERGVSFK